MTETLAALGYLLVLIAVVPRFLREADWTRRAPRIALAVWLATCVSAVTVTLLACALLVAPLSSIGHLLMNLIKGGCAAPTWHRCL
jgi:bla regulator protein blaR1